MNSFIVFLSSFKIKIFNIFLMNFLEPGVRVEADDVFEATHACIFRLYAEGVIDGVRVDHVDGMALPAQAAGRALSAYNLVIFAGVFAMQWAIGLASDALGWLGWSEPARLRGALALFGLAAALAYAGFLRARHRRHVRAAG